MPPINLPGPRSGTTYLLTPESRRLLWHQAGLTPHPAQEEILRSGARFRVVVAGRRFGKSKLAAMEAVAQAGLPEQLIWVVAPTHDLANIIFREVWKRLFTVLRCPFRQRSAARGTIELANGTRLVRRSATRPESLVGEGVNALILDEAALLKPEIWQERLRPTLTDTGGWALFISTPFGFNWYYDLYRSGAFGTQGFRFPTSANPHIPAAEIEQARLSLPGPVFETAYLAAFRSAFGLVFPEFDRAVHVRATGGTGVQGFGGSGGAGTTAAAGEIEAHAAWPLISGDEWATAIGGNEERLISSTIGRPSGLAAAPVILGIDFGFRNPYAVVALQAFGEHVHQCGELYVEGHATEDVIDLARRQPWWALVRGIYCDPESPADILRWLRAAEPARVHASKWPREAGYTALRTLLRNRQWTVSPGCRHTILELEKHAWERGDVPERHANNHAISAIRYALPALQPDLFRGGQVRVLVGGVLREP